MNQSIIGGVFMGVIGLLLVINPHGVWKAAERWKLFGAAETSPAFVAMARVLGIIAAIMGVLVMFGILK